jgi:hypothetical protein
MEEIGAEEEEAEGSVGASASSSELPSEEGSGMMIDLAAAEKTLRKEEATDVVSFPSGPWHREQESLLVPD